jgi:maleylpyruvate isomerase
VTVRPGKYIEGIRTAQARLDDTLTGVTVETMTRPSLLPDWTVGHVLAHLLGNGYSVVRRLEGVVDDRVVDQYPGGAAGREQEIAELAELSYDELFPRLHDNARRIDALLDEVPDDAWERQTRGVGGNLAPADRVVFSRWRELEVHHADLGLGYTFADWPANLAAECLPDLLQGLAGRTDPKALCAWAMGRGSAPELTAWT